MDDILTEDEIRALTDKKKPSAQRKVLDALHIRYTPRPDRSGRLIVLRAHRDAALGLRKTIRQAEQAAAPNFAALDA
jgi:hypothetical protein